MHQQIDISQLISSLWNGKYLIIATASICSLVSLYIAYSKPEIYESTSILNVADGNQANGGGWMQGDISKLATMAGVNLSAGAGASKIVAIETIKSRFFIENLIEENNLKKMVLLSVGWNKEKNELIYSEDVRQENFKKNGIGDAKLIENWKAYSKFSDMMAVDLDQESGLVELRVRHFSPFVARDINLLLIKGINDFLRKKELRDANKNISYLNDKLQETALKDMRQLFNSLVEDQIRKSMLAEVREDYFFQIVSPPMVSVNRAEPNRKLIVVVGSLFGIAMGIVFSLLFFVVLRSDEEFHPQSENDNGYLAKTN